MATAAQDQAATTAAVQAAATADLTRLNAFVVANGASFTAVSNNLATLAGQLSSSARGQQVLTIKAELDQALADFNTLVSTTTAAKTAIPVV